MSLLLDARKKSQGGNKSLAELTLTTEATAPYAPASSLDIEGARTAGHNLFKAKSNAAGGNKVNRNLIYFVMGSLVLFAAGGAYVWYETSAYSRPTYRPVSPPPPAPISAQVYTPPPAQVTEPIRPIETVVAPVEIEHKAPELVATMAPPGVAPKQATPVANKRRAPVKASAQSFIVETDKSDSLDSLLNRAYQAYTAGKYDQAQGLYQDALGKDGRNTDSLLGLAAIAQHRGSDTVAAQYYGRVLTLDPRNPVANAGMSALRTDDNTESHLKTLLNEQKDSSSLYFALGNHYAGLSLWGEAQQAYFNAYNLEPRNASLAYNLAISLERLGQKKPAAQYYKRAIQLDTGNSAGFDHTAIEQHAQLLSE